MLLGDKNLTIIIEAQRIEIERLRAALQDARQGLNLALLADSLSGEIKNRLRTSWLKVGDALADEQSAVAKHDPRTGPCPTCGFFIREVERQTFVIDDEQSAAPANPDEGLPTADDVRGILWSISSGTK